VFDNTLEQLDDFEALGSLSADGQATDIAGAVTRALATTSRPDAAVILISDGIDNTSSDVGGAVRGVVQAVHTIRVGSEQTEPATLANIAIDNVETEGDLVVGHETPVRVTVKSSALANRVVD